MRSLIQKATLIAGDIFALFLSLVITKLILLVLKPNLDYRIVLGSLGFSKLIGLLVIAVFWHQEQYAKRRPVWEELRILYHTIFIFAVIHLGVSYVVSHHVVKTSNIIFWLTLLITLPTCRYLIKYYLNRFNLWHRRVYIIGMGSNALATYELLNSNKILGYTISGFVNLNQEEPAHLIDKDIPILNYATLLDDTFKRADVEIIFALPTHELVDNINKINLLQSKYNFVSIVPDITGLPLYGVELDHFFGSDQLFLRLQNNLGRRLNRIMKRITDIILSLIGILLLSPIFLLIGILIILNARSKVFFKHKRIGIDGKAFYCLKFQTMYPNSQEILAHILATDMAAKVEWEKDFKLKNDPRVTKIGLFLRKTSLDELPQLFNVLFGSMSLIGPRPIVEDEIKKYDKDFYYYKLVRPGITGLWQISGRNDVDYQSRVRLDVWYVKNWSLWYDFIILLRTVMVVLKRSGAY